MQGGAKIGNIAIIGDSGEVLASDVRTDGADAVVAVGPSGLSTKTGLSITDDTTTVPAVTTISFPGATVTTSGPGQATVTEAGGGGAAIQPETGSSGIKISAFPDAAMNMAAADRVTGLRGGANANFSQAQLIAGANAPASSAAVGTPLYMYAGAGDGASAGGAAYVKAGQGGLTGNGGASRLYGGSGGTTSGNGGLADHRGGQAYVGTGGGAVSGGGGSNNGDGGYFQALGGDAGVSGDGGYVFIRGGSGTGAGKHGGNITLAPGSGVSSAAVGHLIINNLPVSAAGLPSGAIWLNTNVLTRVP